jgi:hypothetical protein
MISSEVQRTLVKSPPELWTELSNPESLARHLGELGEIEITRVKPEELVEWEAEGTKGTVALKASGWGTRVTLTVNRELPEPVHATPEEPVGEQPTAEHPETHPGGNSAEEADSEPLASPSEAPDIEPTASPASEATAAGPPAEPVAVSPEAPAADIDTPPLEPTPAPATEAARRAMGWPGTPPDAGPAIESDLRAAEMAAGEWEQEPETAWLEASAPASDNAESFEPEQELPEPKRGFFARLFGRRRRKAVAAAPDLAPPDVAEHELAEPELPDTACASAHADGVDVTTEPEQPVAEHPSAEDPPPVEPASVEHRAPVEAATAEHDPSAQDLDPAPEPIAEAPPEAAAPETEREQPRADLAAELKAAEEAAAEEVTAVLTGVLDRLGAAHHRPFSRA